MVNDIKSLSELFTASISVLVLDFMIIIGTIVAMLWVHLNSLIVLVTFPGSAFHHPPVRPETCVSLPERACPVGGNQLVSWGEYRSHRNYPTAWSGRGAHGKVHAHRGCP